MRLEPKHLSSFVLALALALSAWVGIAIELGLNRKDILPSDAQRFDIEKVGIAALRDVCPAFFDIHGIADIEHCLNALDQDKFIDLKLPGLASVAGTAPNFFANAKARRPDVNWEAITSQGSFYVVKIDIPARLYTAYEAPFGRSASAGRPRAFNRQQDGDIFSLIHGTVRHGVVCLEGRCQYSASSAGQIPLVVRDVGAVSGADRPLYFFLAESDFPIGIQLDYGLFVAKQRDLMPFTLTRGLVEQGSDLRGALWCLALFIVAAAFSFFQRRHFEYAAMAYVAGSLALNFGMFFLSMYISWLRLNAYHCLWLWSYLNLTMAIAALCLSQIGVQARSVTVIIVAGALVAAVVVAVLRPVMGIPRWIAFWQVAAPLFGIVWIAMVLAILSYSLFREHKSGAKKSRRLWIYGGLWLGFLGHYLFVTTDAVGKDNLYEFSSFSVMLLLVMLGVTAYSYWRRDQDEIERLQKANEAAVRSVAVAATTQMLAHDIRKPFSILRMGLQMIRGAKDADDLQMIVADTERHVNRASKAVEGMLSDILEIDRKSTSHKEAVDLVKAMREALAEIRLTRSDLMCEWKVDLQEGQVVIGDEIRLQRVFSNLLENAVQAAPTGRIWVASRTMRREAGETCQIRVGNSGTFIEKSRLDVIFQPFFSFGKKGGTGLGLAIAKKIVEEHGGRIWCESTPSEGTEFILEIPV
jgi:signal transduction histidine kinase